QLPLDLRLANASVSYLRYLARTVWPAGLSAFYPFQGVEAWKIIASVAAVAGISALVLVRRRQSPWLAAGWAWYLIALLPVIGIVQVGMQSMADRYMYAPMIGLLIAVAWEAEERARNLRAAPRLLVAAAVLVLAG